MTDNEKYDLYSPFDIEKHKQTFINYLEVVILSNGEIQYAVPSHMEKMIVIIGEPREKLIEKMPITASPLEWLIEKSNCISVWSGFYKGNPKTEQQKTTLKQLIDNGLTQNRQIS